MNKLKIVFIGTPEFSVPMLDILNSNHNVVGVLTMPDKVGGRGNHVIESAVKVRANELGIKVLQPEKLRNQDFLEELKSLEADLFVCVAFRMMPEVVWSMPRLGTVNLHTSLLPQYRGSAPINWAIINGEKETGVTTFFIQHEIDTGKIIHQESIPIPSDETVGELYEKMIIVGSKVLLKTVNDIASGSYPQIDQVNLGNLKTAPKISTETCRIDWSKKTEDVFNLIRGLNPYPAAFTVLNGKIFKIFKCDKVIDRVVPDINRTGHGTDGKTYLRFYCSDGYIDVKECQMEGKKRMSIGDYLRGNKFGVLN